MDSPTPTRRLYDWLPLLPVLACYGVLKSYGLHLLPGDEGIYFYMAARIAEDGLIPYRDFFFAHPPVHLLPAVLAFEILGTHSWVSKLLAPLMGGLTLALVYGVTRARLGLAGALAASLLLLGSYDFLRGSTHFTGVNVTLALATLAAALVIHRRMLWAGGVAAAACMAGVYAVPTALGCLLLSLLSGKRDGLRFLAVWAGSLLLAHGLLLWLSDGAFYEQVYAYHFAKPGTPGQARSMALRVLVDNAALTLAAGGAGWVLLLTWLTLRWGPGGSCMPVGLQGWRAALFDEGRLAFAGAALLLGLGNLAVLASLQKAYPFYFLMAFPALAVAGGLLGSLLWDAYVRLVDPPLVFDRVYGLLALLLLLAGASAAEAKWPSVRARLAPGSVNSMERSYAWQAGAYLPPWLDAAVFRLLWEPRRGVEGEYSGPTRYLWHESRRQPLLEEVAAYLGPAGEGPEPIFGDSLTAPYLAFLTGRKVAGEEADSNAARFRSGATDPGQLIAELRESELRYVVARTGRGFFRIEAFRRWVDEALVLERRWADPRGGHLLLLRPR